MARCTEALRTLDEALHQLVGCDKERSQLSAQVQQLEQEFMNYCDEPSARQSPLPSSDSSQFLSTCSSSPLVFGCSNVAC